MTDCSNAQPGSQLSNLCACKRASDSLADTLNTYDQQIASYNSQQSNYQAYQNALQQWQTKYDAEKNWYAKQTNGPPATCGAAGNANASTCPTGWTQQGSNTDTCDVCVNLGPFGGNVCAKTGRLKICVPDTNNVNSHMSDWQNKNPKPNVVSPAGDSPKPPGNININCCSQMFSNINATTVNFSDINQTCNQSITTQIQQLGVNPTTALNNSNSSTIPSSVVYGIAAILIIFILYYLLFM